MSQTALCLFSLPKGFFVGATNLGLQQQLLSQFLHVLHLQPSGRTLNSENLHIHMIGDLQLALELAHLSLFLCTQMKKSADCIH
jgi:hypothetical protein